MNPLLGCISTNAPPCPAGNGDPKPENRKAPVGGGAIPPVTPIPTHRPIACLHSAGVLPCARCACTTWGLPPSAPRLPPGAATRQGPAWGAGARWRMRSDEKEP
jgi:hypothetical protein